MRKVTSQCMSWGDLHPYIANSAPAHLSYSKVWRLEAALACCLKKPSLPVDASYSSLIAHVTSALEIVGSTERLTSDNEKKAEEQET